MTFTYDPTDITTDLAKVRTLIGDTQIGVDELLTDEQVNFFLGQKPDIYLAAIDSAKAILAKFVRDIDRSNIGMSASRSQKIQHLKDLISELETESKSQAEVFVGGVSIDEHTTSETDTDLVQPKFIKDQDDNPAAGDHGGHPHGRHH